MRVSVNFASREYLIARRAYAVIMAGILICGTLFLLQYSSYRGNSRQIEDTRHRLEEAKREKEEMLANYNMVSTQLTPSIIEHTAEEARFASEVINSKSFSWTLFLNRFEELVPYGVGIQGISPDFGTLAISINGTAKDMPTLLDFIDNLTASEYFADLPPNFKSSQTVVDKDTNRKAEVFNLSIQYFPDGNDGGSR